MPSIYTRASFPNQNADTPVRLNAMDPIHSASPQKIYECHSHEFASAYIFYWAGAVVITSAREGNKPSSFTFVGRQEQHSLHPHCGSHPDVPNAILSQEFFSQRLRKSGKS
jgi:hypothetical protein